MGLIFSVTNGIADSKIVLISTTMSQPHSLSPWEGGELAMKRIDTNETSNSTGCISPIEFDCQSPLKFYEHCKTCPRFNDDCRYLKMGLELLLREKVLRYDLNVESPIQA